MAPKNKNEASVYSNADDNTCIEYLNLQRLYDYFGFFFQDETQ